MIVPQQAEVAEVSVLIVNQGIENQHTAKLLVELVAQGLVIIKAGFQRRLAENTPDRDERGINIRKQPALGSKDPFPVFQVVLYAADAHLVCDLTGIILAVRLVSGVRSTLRAALIQIDAVILHKPPSLPQHTVGSQLRRGGERLPAAAHAGISHQRQRFGEAVFVEVVIGILAVTVGGDDPIAVVEGQPHTDIHDALRVVYAKPQRL